MLYASLVCIFIFFDSWGVAYYHNNAEFLFCFILLYSFRYLSITVLCYVDSCLALFLVRYCHNQPASKKHHREKQAKYPPPFHKSPQQQPHHHNTNPPPPSPPSSIIHPSKKAECNLPLPPLSTHAIHPYFVLFFFFSPIHPFNENSIHPSIHTPTNPFRCFFLQRMRFQRWRWVMSGCVGGRVWNVANERARGREGRVVT
ncbi:hypothetical protein L873DRAFT_1160680 [Choiromyces venosus 120613-1]|uniref:Uncharacterized protein n=1 Tax=Choiromyces venosus 120613-1 TaxID=1336337 RepID=A0A3N4JJN8_9PEZI|nr:hypothetical protein L873DRAFT_1160680 [Choiromyces venosus 120613-1]